MLYDVKCGRHKRTVESECRHGAAKKVVGQLLDGDLEIGGVISVTIPGGGKMDMMFFDTGGLIEECMVEPPPPKQYQITLVA